MPIRPENRSRYPGGGLHSKQWQAIRQEVGERSGWRCEGSPGFYPHCNAEHAQPHPVTGARVVLTVAHLDHDPQNNAMSNLRHLCQRCHNAYDAAHRRQTQKNERAIGDLFDRGSARDVWRF